MIRRLIDAAKIVDARSTRSKQKKVGASDVSVCRRRAGYKKHGVKPSNPENGASIEAIVGTWIHKGALDTMRREWGSQIEVVVEDDLLRGHIDALELPNDLRVKAGLEEHPLAPETVEVDDLKTKRDVQAVQYVRSRGPKRRELFQAHLYADLARRGKIRPLARQKGIAELGPLDVETVRLRYFARSGSDDGEYPYEQPYDHSVTEEALAWVLEVAASKSPEELPRDEDGPGLSYVCDNCPFLEECWGPADPDAPARQSLLIVTDADLADVMREYDEQRAIEAEAKKRKDKARLILDATGPAIYTDGEESFRLKWSGGKPTDPKPDMEAIERLFEKAGTPMPMLQPGTSAKTIMLSRWEPPEQVCGKPVGDPTPWRHEVAGVDDAVCYLQDRPRGGWTAYEVVPTPELGQKPEDYGWVPGEEVETMTAGQFEKRFPDYVDPRPTCILKKGHSDKPCWTDQQVVELEIEEVGDDSGERAAG